MSVGEAFEKFVEVVRALRHPETGCPWDLEQTHESLRQYLIEECYEVLEAIDAGDRRELSMELGDVLLQVVLHSQLASEAKQFSIQDVIENVTRKMVTRHPHVFGDKAVSGSAEVLKNWEAIKLEEKKGQARSSDALSPLLEGVPKSMPALGRAQRLGEKAAKVGFDWKSISGVWEKVEEEIRELKTELEAFQKSEKPSDEIRAALERELGDLLFSLAQLARWAGVNGEESLRETCQRFSLRFTEMEKLLKRPIDSHSEDELEALWQKAKQRIAASKE